MPKNLTGISLAPAATAAISLALIAFGWWAHQALPLTAGFVGVIALLTSRIVRTQRDLRRETALPPLPSIHKSRRQLPEDEGALVENMIAQRRYGLLLRRELAGNLDQKQLQAAVAALEEHMALVPGGTVVVGQIDAALEDGKIDLDSIERHHARLVEISPAFLDRAPVTNREFYEFVAGGGYDEMAIWDEEIWPAVLDFVDASGHPGPKFWRNGGFADGEEKLPVVGVSWYEAAAYARWVGKRLPTDPEWVKAGAWPVALREGIWLQRKYPWGQTFDHEKANLWGSGGGTIAPVDAFEGGTSVGGVQQLIGNVWEWTSSNFGKADDLTLTLPTPMKSIRGGAFDTYFETHATCHFQSGSPPLDRKHNIGFRLAISARDLSPRIAERDDDPDSADAVSTDEASTDAEQLVAGVGA